MTKENSSVIEFSIEERLFREEILRLKLFATGGCLVGDVIFQYTVQESEIA